MSNPWPVEISLLVLYMALLLAQFELALQNERYLRIQSNKLANNKSTVALYQPGGSVADWLGHRTLMWGSTPALTTKLELFFGRPYFKSSAMLLNSQLVFTPPVGIF